MDLATIERLSQRIKQEGFQLSEGMTEDELAQVEQINGFQFPTDLRLFLQHVLPVGDKFPNWRDNNVKKVFQDSQDFLLSVILFDVEFQRQPYWLPQWGSQPSELTEAKRVVTDLFHQAPLLIPIYGHRFMPSTPPRAGNPVFSIWQTDIICFGTNLEKYLINEFDRENADVSFMDYQKDCDRPFPFWDDLYEANNGPFRKNC